MKYLGVFTINGKQTIRERETENDLRADMEEIKERETHHFPHAKEGTHFTIKVFKVIDEDTASPVYVPSDKPIVGKGTKIWHYTVIQPSARIGENCSIGSYVEIGKNVVIGNNVRVGAKTSLFDGTVVEDNAWIGPHVATFNDKYPPSHGNHTPVTIKSGAVIGGGAMILPGVTIHSGARIGAGSVVTKDVPSGVTVCGNPAKIHNKFKLPPTRKTDGGVPFDI